MTTFSTSYQAKRKLLQLIISIIILAIIALIIGAKLLTSNNSSFEQKANEILRSLERKNILTGKKQEKTDKKQVEGQFDLYNYKLAEIAHEIDKINLNELTPIDALNTLVRMKEKMK